MSVSISQTLSEKTRELDKLRSEWTSQTSSLSSRHSQELQSEREKAVEVTVMVWTWLNPENTCAQLCIQTTVELKLLELKRFLVWYSSPVMVILILGIDYRDTQIQDELQLRLTGLYQCPLHIKIHILRHLSSNVKNVYESNVISWKFNSILMIVVIIILNVKQPSKLRFDVFFVKSKSWCKITDNVKHYLVMANVLQLTFHGLMLLFVWKYMVKPLKCCMSDLSN